MPVGWDNPGSLGPADLTGLCTLIMGEVKTGKTALLSRILDMFLEQGAEGLVVMDMAPDLIRGIGGKLTLPQAPGLRVFSPSISAPRLTGRDPQEVRELAENNARAIEHEMKLYLAEPGECLFINDVSMYLQAREPGGLMPLVEATPTVVMNGYYGRALGGGEFGDRERERMEALGKLCQRVVEL